MKSKLQVWWIPQVPMKSFKVDVSSVKEAIKIMDILADYDRFQYDNRIKPDYANMGGLSIWDEDESEYIDWWIEFSHSGTSHYFDYPEEYMNFLEDNNLTEADIES